MTREKRTTTLTLTSKEIYRYKYNEITVRYC